LPLPCTPKVGLIHLNLTRELGASSSSAV
jgi:hypothetical protein